MPAEQLVTDTRRLHARAVAGLVNFREALEAFQKIHQQSRLLVAQAQAALHHDIGWRLDPKG